MTVKIAIHETYRNIFLIRTTVCRITQWKKKVNVENGLHYEMDFTGIENRSV